MITFGNTLKKIVRRINTPLVIQAPFVFFLFFAWGMDLYEDLFSPLFTYDLKVFVFNLITRSSLYLCNVFFFLYFFAFSLEFVNKKGFTIFVYVFFVILTIVKYFLQNVFGIGITPAALVLLVETNYNEAKEFVQTFMLRNSNLPFLFLLILFTILIYYIESWYEKAELDEYKRKLINSRMFTFVILGAAIFSFIKIHDNLSSMLNNRSMDELSGFAFEANLQNPFTDLIYSTYGILLMNKEELSFERNIDSLNSESASCTGDDSLNIVVVIGESYIKHHAGIYGYSLNTTPNLTNEKNKENLYIFNDVVTPYGYTSITIKNVLCVNSISKGEKWSTSYFFPQLFKIAGYKVYFWDNQKTWDENSTFTFTLNTFLYNKPLLSKVYDKTNMKSYTYDEDLIESFKTEKISTKRNLIMFHLKGQHFRFKERFPHNEHLEFFTKDDIKRDEAWMTDEKRQLIADYDNATLYNDYIISKIIDLFRDSKSVVIYFSDHGEEVYDYRDSFGRTGPHNRNKLKYIYQIPFMIWCSNSYRSEHPEIIRLIQSSLYRPFMIDNLSHVLFHIGNIKTRYYYKERDLISSEFLSGKRIVGDKYDYDSLMWN